VSVTDHRSDQHLVDTHVVEINNCHKACSAKTIEQRLRHLFSRAMPTCANCTSCMAYWPTLIG